MLPEERERASLLFYCRAFLTLGLVVESHLGFHAGVDGDRYKGGRGERQSSFLTRAFFHLSYATSRELLLLQEQTRWKAPETAGKL